MEKVKRFFWTIGGCAAMMLFGMGKFLAEVISLIGYALSKFGAYIGEGADLMKIDGEKWLSGKPDEVQEEAEATEG